MRPKTYIYCLFLLFSGCGAAESNTALELFVYNRNSEPEDSATVNIYADSADWILEKNAVRIPETTNSDGRVRFFGLNNGLYFVDVIKENRNNWEGRVLVPLNAEEDFSLNTELIIVNRSRSGLISEARGAKWFLERAELNGIDALENLTPCILDDTLFFYKGSGNGDFLLHEGTAVCEGKAASREGSWELNDSGSDLNIVGDRSELWKIISVDDQKLVVSRSLGAFVFQMSYRRAN